MYESVNPKNVVAVILGGGQGTRLFPLTQYRSKPAVPIGGKYRLIDIPISNCLHAGVNKIFVLTQFNSASLNRHISATYQFDSFSDGFVEILAAEQTQDSPDWYQGTADAVRQQRRHILSRKADQCLILSGDHLYRMDYRAFLFSHQEREAEVSIAVKPVDRQKAPALGILQAGKDRRVLDFHEKPQEKAELNELELEAPPGDNPSDLFLASMGIYVFDSRVLTSLLETDRRADFGRHIIPAAIQRVRVFAHPFHDYWEDIGTIRSFYEANLALTNADPPFEFDLPDAPIYTHQRYLGGARLGGCRIERGIVADGSYIGRGEIEHSVIGIRSIIGEGTRIYHTVVMGADYYETTSDLESNVANGVPHVGIGANSVISRAIIDKNARIGEKVIIANDRGIKEADAENYFIRDGIVLVPKGAVIPAGTVI